MPLILLLPGAPACHLRLGVRAPVADGLRARTVLVSDWVYSPSYTSSVVGGKTSLYLVVCYSTPCHRVQLYSEATRARWWWLAGGSHWGGARSAAKCRTLSISVHLRGFFFCPRAQRKKRRGVCHLTTCFKPLRHSPKSCDLDLVACRLPLLPTCQPPTTPSRVAWALWLLWSVAACGLWAALRLCDIVDDFDLELTCDSY
jgi:hypothetical protein